MSEGRWPGPDYEPEAGGFLRLLEHREDLERLCTRLTGDALSARALAEARAREGDPADASRCRRLAREAARRALTVLWEYRQTASDLDGGG